MAVDFSFSFFFILSFSPSSSSLSIRFLWEKIKHPRGLYRWKLFFFFFFFIFSSSQFTINAEKSCVCDQSCVCVHFDHFGWNVARWARKERLSHFAFLQCRISPHYFRRRQLKMETKEAIDLLFTHTHTYLTAGMSRPLMGK